MTAGSLDSTGRSMVLSRHLIPAALMVHAGAGTPEALWELETASVMFDGHLHPVASSILGVMTDPETVATVELTTTNPASSPTTTNPGSSLTTLWVHRDHAVVGESRDSDMFALHLVDRPLVPFHLAQIVGIGRRPAPGVSESVEIPTSLVAASRPHWRSQTELCQLLVAGGVEQEAAAALALAHVARVATWRITVLHMGTDRVPLDKEIVVLDGDAGGMWQLIAEGGPSGSIWFVPLEWFEVITLLARTIQSGV